MQDTQFVSSLNNLKKSQYLLPEQTCLNLLIVLSEWTSSNLHSWPSLGLISDTASWVHLDRFDHRGHLSFLDSGSLKTAVVHRCNILNDAFWRSIKLHKKGNESLSTFPLVHRSTINRRGYLPVGFSKVQAFTNCTLLYLCRVSIIQLLLKGTLLHHPIQSHPSPW